MKRELDEKLKPMVAPAFYRSVNIVQDWNNACFEYITSSATLELASDIALEVGRPMGDRAWTITGPYGCGKSAFALFLADVLSRKTPLHETARKIRCKTLTNAPPLKPILCVADRAPLGETLANGLKLNGRTLSDVSEFATFLPKLVNETEGGILLVVDELGKYLEYAAKNDSEDLFFLQQCAEFASRSKKPVVFLGILHSSFSDYLDIFDSTQRNEWQKVQGRFRNVPFSIPPDQVLDLVASAIDVRLSDSSRRNFEHIIDHLLGTDLGDCSISNRKKLVDQLYRCLPLHPQVAKLLWPIYRSQVSQNERSLFSFLTSYEPLGFRRFCEQSSSVNMVLFTLPDLYDYLIDSIGTSIFSGQYSREWGLIQHALLRLGADSDPIKIRLIKTIGLIQLFGRDVELRATASTLRGALACSVELPAADTFQTALTDLLAASLIIYRRHTNSYRIWEGSDVDLERTFERARRRLVPRPLSERLSEVVRLQPFLAKQHQIETGTMRFVVPFFADCTNVFPSTHFNKLQADIKLLFIVDTQVRRSELIKRACEWSTRTRTDSTPTLVAVPKQVPTIAELLLSYECWVWIRDHQAELEEDPIAKEEVRNRILQTKDAVRSRIGSTFGIPGTVLNPKLIDWYWNGSEIQELQVPRDFQHLLSQICAKVYHNTPILHNDLLNRNHLTSNAVSARRTLIRRVMNDDLEFEFGKYPPERAMFHAMLERGGFWTQNKQLRHLSLRGRGSKSTWHATWTEIKNFFHRSRDKPLQLTDLYEKLRRPPLGLRIGVIPVLIAVWLRIEGKNTILYEEGVFVAELGDATLERLVRNPEMFKVRWCSKRSTRTLCDHIAETEWWQSITTISAQSPTIVDVARELLKTLFHLPLYVRQTNRLSSTSARIREALLAARDPVTLILKTIPELLGTREDDIAKPLNDVVEELKAAFPRMLNRIEVHAAEKFKYSEFSQTVSLYRFLDDRGERLQHLISSESDLGMFFASLKGLIESDKGDKSERFALILSKGRPPKDFSDADEQNVITRINTLSLEIEQLLMLNYHKMRLENSSDTVFRIEEHRGSGQYVHVVQLDEQDVSTVRLIDRLTKILDESNLEDRKKLVALARKLNDIAMLSHRCKEDLR